MLMFLNYIQFFRVHVLGSAHRKHDHPDGRAIMFEEVQYSKNKIKDLLSIIKGFRTCAEIIALLEGECIVNLLFL